MDVPTDRILMTLVAATAVIVFAVGWGLIDTRAVGGQLVRAGIVVAFLALVAGFWLLFRRMDENRGRAD